MNRHYDLQIEAEAEAWRLRRSQRRKARWVAFLRILRRLV